MGRGMFGFGEKMGVGEFSPRTHHLRGKHFLPKLGRKPGEKSGEGVLGLMRNYSSTLPLFNVAIFFFGKCYIHFFLILSVCLSFFFFLFLPKYVAGSFFSFSFSFLPGMFRFKFFFPFNFNFWFIRLCYVLFFSPYILFFLLVLRM